MKHLFQTARLDEVRTRLAQLRPDSERAWDKMTPAQTLAHCSGSFDMAMGKISEPRIFIGRILGPMAKRSLILKGEPMRRNSLTAKSVFIADDRDFAVEKQRLNEQIDRFIASGPAGCSKDPHFFFGSLTPEEWAGLMYQHLDHHLRQFGV